MLEHPTLHSVLEGKLGGIYIRKNNKTSLSALKLLTKKPQNKCVQVIVDNVHVLLYAMLHLIVV